MEGQHVFYCCLAFLIFTFIITTVVPILNKKNVVLISVFSFTFYIFTVRLWRSIAVKIF